MSQPVQPPDPNRRRFFRQFAGDVVTSVGSVLGAAQSLQETSAEAARDLLGGEVVPVAPGGPGSGSRPATPAAGELDASTAGWRAPFRWDGDVCRIVDQRRLPDVLVDLEVRGTADTVNAIRDGALVGVAVQAQVAAVTLALVAARAAGSRAFARRATIRGAANALRVSREGSAPMAATLDRMLALLEAAGLDTPGETVAAWFHDEAGRIIAEATDDHGALVGHLLTALPGSPEDPLRVLVAGSTGAMAGGQFGTALSAIQTVHHAGRPVHALVAEGRPGLEGSRVSAWELRQAGVDHAVVTDAAGPGLVAAGEVHAVLVGADRICANGDVVTTVGAYPLALACAASGTPFIVCAATPAISLEVPAAGDAVLEAGRPTQVLRVAGTRVAPEGTSVRNPVQDAIPAGLITAIVTETGVLRTPFAPALEASVAVASAGRESAAGFAALLAQRAAASAAAANRAATGEGAAATGEGATAAGAAATPSAAGDEGAPRGDGHVDVAALRNPARGTVS